MATGNYLKVEVSLDMDTIRDVKVLAQRRNEEIDNAWDVILKEGIDSIYKKSPALHQKEIDNSLL